MFKVKKIYETKKGERIYFELKYNGKKKFYNVAKGLFSILKQVSTSIKTTSPVA